MAKHEVNSDRPASSEEPEALGRLSSHLPGAIRPAPPRTARRWCIASGLTVLSVIVCTVLVQLALPEKVPMIWQRLLGLVCASAAVAVLAWATREKESSEEEMLIRARRGQHADFGKRLREAQKVRTTVKLPLMGETSIRGLAGVAVFLVMAAWWLSPWAPVGVRDRAIPDLSLPLTEEILAVVLVMPDENMAVPQPPIPPAQARRLAEKIDDGGVTEGKGANFYHRGLKAIAQGRFKDARQLLAKAMRFDDAEAYDIHVARAQNEMYAGQFESASQWYRNALQKNPNDPRLLCQMAVARLQLGRFDEAQPLIDRALKESRVESRKSRETESAESVESPETEALDVLPREGGLSTLEYAACLHIQTVLNVGLGKHYDESVKDCVRTRAILADALDRDHPFEAASLNNHATVYLLQAKYQGAHELYGQAVDLWNKPPKSHSHAAAGLANLAMLHCHLGQYAKDPSDKKGKDQAKELAGQALAGHLRNLPGAHPILGISCNVAAVVDAALARYEQAQPLAEKSLAILEAALGPEHGDVAAPLDTLATIYAGQALYTKAELYYLQAIEVASNAWGPKHPYLAGILNHLANLHIEQGRFEEAEARCAEALDILATPARGGGLGEKHPALAIILNTRGKLEIARGKLGDAESPLEEAEKILKKALAPEAAAGEEHPRLAETIGLLAATDARSPLYYDRGVKRYLRAIQMRQKRFGPQHPDRARLLRGLAALHDLRRKPQDAEACLRQALDIQEKSLVPFHPDLADTLQALATLVRKTRPDDSKLAALMEERARSILDAHAEEDRLESSRTRD